MLSTFHSIFPEPETALKYKVSIKKYTKQPVILFDMFAFQNMVCFFLEKQIVFHREE